MKTKHQKNCLKIALICFTLAVIAWLFIDCADLRTIVEGQRLREMVCRHEALMAITVMGEQPHWSNPDLKSYPVRICWGRSGTGLHAQGEAKIDGKWIPLMFSDDWVVAGGKDNYIRSECLYPLYDVRFPFLNMKAVPF